MPQTAAEAAAQTPIQVVHPYYKIVKGLPAAVVRSYKEPLYDSEVILAANPTREFVLYSKPIGQTLNDGVTVKNFLFSNQTQAGTLGNPLSFDVYGFNKRVTGILQKIITVGNYTDIEGSGVAEVIFGQDTKFLTIPIEDVASGVDTEGLGATDAPHIGLGVSDNFYRFDVGGRSLHINSTETYQVKISWPAGSSGITGNLLFRWYMRGIRYKGV